MGFHQLVATKDIPRMLLPATKCIHRMQIMKRKPANAYFPALSSQSVLIGASPDSACFLRICIYAYLYISLCSIHIHYICKRI